MVRVISWGDTEDVVGVLTAAWAKTWLKLELLMVSVISCGPLDEDTRPWEVMTWESSCPPWWVEKKKKDTWHHFYFLSNIIGNSDTTVNITLVCRNLVNTNFLLNLLHRVQQKYSEQLSSLINFLTQNSFFWY